jgi:MFS family permease
VSAVSGGSGSTGDVALAVAGGALLLAFVAIELAKARRGQEPLLDLRRFRDRTFAFSGLANVFVAAARFGTVFLLPIYLQGLRQQTPFEAGMILAAQALATVVVLPIGGRLADRVGSRPVALVGLAFFTGGMGLMTTLGMETPIWMVVGMLVVVGSASGFVNQILVTAMSGIEKDERKEVANGSTILTVLHATAAPLGVGLLSSMAQGRSVQHAERLAAEGVVGELLEQQSTLLGMRNSFAIGVGLLAAAIVAMSLTQGRRENG